MKKLICIIISAIMLCVTLVGCEPTEAVDTSATQYTTEGKTTKLVGDPNATGELTVAILGTEIKYGETIVDQTSIAARKFQELYPNVKLTFERTPVNYSDSNYRENYYKKLSAEVMAGKGPDVFFPDSGMTWDVNKLMQSGSLADLTEYFENDKDFNIGDYNENVFYSGQYMGKQYVVPTGYYIPFLITTQEVLDESGFNIKKCKDYISCYEEVARVERAYRSGASKIKAGAPSLSILTVGYPAGMGIDLTGNEAIDTPEMKKMFELYKELFYQSEEMITGGDGSDDIVPFIKKEFVISVQDRLASVLDIYQELKDKGATPIVFPWRDLNGNIQAEVFKYMAVNGNSKNIENAYRFIKVAVSPDVQGYKDVITGTILRDELIGVSIVNNVNLSKLEERSKPVEMTINNTYMFGKSPSLLPKSFIDQMTGYFDEAKVSCIGDSAYIRILKTAMKPYLNDEKSYEECIKKAQEQLEIYVSE